MGNTPSTQSIQTQIESANIMAKQASEALICGPDCQKDKNEANLKQIYYNAVTNLGTAPAQLAQAEKNYYTFKQGISGYNEFLSGKFGKIMVTLKSDLNSIFNAHIGELINSNDIYQSLYITHQRVKDYYSNLQFENNNIETKYIY